MRFETNTRDLLDMVIEEVALNSGIMLADHDVRALLEKTPMSSWAKVFEQPPNRLHLVRPEFVVELARVLRASVGNLPDATPGVIVSARMLAELADRCDVEPIMKAFHQVLRSGKHASVGSDFLDEVVAASSAAPADVLTFILAIGEQQNRDSARFFFGGAESSDWDGIRPLSELFEVESVPDDPDSYLDQRFLDFLAVQGESLTSMHWRNFERLTAEFFRRSGFQVRLGPGSRDGGVDLRVWLPGEVATKPPLLVVQCKRYAEHNSVEVECIKALWADLVFEGAEKGLIATTSRVSPDGKRVCSARKYPLSIAENDKVKDWSRSMWTFPWEGKSKFEFSGRFGVPPIITPGVFDPYGLSSPLDPDTGEDSD